MAEFSIQFNQRKPDSIVHVTNAPPCSVSPFIDLPPKYHYADYYEIIKNPICMKTVERKINRKEYQSLKEFKQDVTLLCNNCRTYNEDASLLYQDANKIEVRKS